VPELPVTASWAWISKKPGEAGYTILAKSDDTPFGKYIGQYVTGTPGSSMEASAPGAPPWVAFGPFVRDGDLLMSVSIQDWWQGSDNSSRQVWPQRFFLMRYEEVAAARGSYRQLWAALQDVWLPTEPCAPVPLSLPGMPTAEITRTVEHYGCDRMAALAAMVLEDRIALGDATRLDRDDRMAVLDAVLALLPYGLRREVSASTAVDNTVTHGMDLVFASFPNKQVLVSLSRESPMPVPRTEHGLAYRGLLLEKVASSGIQAVIDHLWLATGVHRLDRPEESLATLRELDFDGSLLRRLAAGLATRPEVLAFFQRTASQVASTWQSRSMTPAMRRTALLLILDDSGKPAASALASRWQTIQPAMLQVASEWLDAGDRELPWHCLGIAALANGLDGFLSELIDSQRLTPAARAPRRSALVSLLLSYDPPTQGQLAETLSQVWHDQQPAWQWELFRSLLADQFQSAKATKAAGWAAWMSGPGLRDIPPWIADLRFALLGAGAAESARLPWCDDPGWAAMVLRLAAAHGNLPAALSRAESILLAMTVSETAQAMAPVLAVFEIDLWKAGVPAHYIAIVDAMRALHGHSPAGFPARCDDDLDYDGYFDGLRHVFSSEGLPARKRADLAMRFLRHAVPATQPADAAAVRSPGGIRLLNAWSADLAKRDYVVDYIGAMPDAARPLDEDLDAAYWTLLAGYRDLAAYASTHALATVARKAAVSPDAELTRWTDPDNGLGSSALALACYRARLAELPISEIMRALGKADIARIGARKLDEVLRDFNVLLFYDDSYQGKPQEDLLNCYAHIWGNELGSEFAKDFRDYLVRKCRDEIKVRKWLLKATSHAKPALFAAPRRGWRRRKPKWPVVGEQLRREREQQEFPDGNEQSTRAGLKGMQQ
jgi:hypothetical protein